MEIHCRPWVEAGPAARVAWTGLRASNPALRSPYFAWEFVDAVAQHVDGVELAVLGQERRAVGYFAFERRGSGTAVPVGTPMSDAHGLVASPGLRVDPVELLEACGLQRFEFDHLVASATGFEPYVRAWARSPCLDLSAGLEAWRVERQGQGRSGFRRLRELRRALGRACGPVRFELDVRDAGVLEQAFAHKSAQYRRTLGAELDLFARPAMAAVVRNLFTCRSAELSGLLSALWAGERLVAIHFGLRSGRLLHWWFPTYDTELSTFSPGALLLLDLVEAAAPAGLEVVDFGKGDESYKLRFANTDVRLGEGVVDVVEAHRLRTYLDQELSDAQLRRANLALEREIRRLAAWQAYRAARHDLECLRGAWSWRLSGPLRAAIDALRGAASVPVAGDGAPKGLAAIEAATLAARSASQAIRRSLSWRLAAPLRRAGSRLGVRT